MRKLNEILPRLQEEFEDALNRGDVLELEPGSLKWLDDALLDAPAS